ncbi:hypothetical protein RB653_005169 [Dictyostelium firmibasis]|uniref:Oligopeptide transporter n=1 Tax=Dictyostelium firmibasis TaxID=79012 RepID=A0AAN7U7B2_9MYCE
MYNNNNNESGEEDDLRQYHDGNLDNEVVKNERNFIDDEEYDEDNFDDDGILTSSQIDIIKKNNDISSNNNINNNNNNNNDNNINESGSVNINNNNVKNNSNNNNNNNNDSHLAILKQFTFRSVFVGLIIGCMLCFSNMYYGLQSGFITMGSLQSTLLGFLFFKVFSKFFQTRFNQFENVLLQTVAVATATMPLAGGFVGIIPALRILYNDEINNSINNNNNNSTSSESLVATTPELPNYFTWWGLILWSFSIAFFGLFFSVPLRRQTILVEKLKFPSGAATAQMIKVLHNLKDSEVHSELLVKDIHGGGGGGGGIDSMSDGIQLIEDSPRGYYGDEDDLLTYDEKQIKIKKSWDKKVKVLFYSFLVSFIYTMLSYFFPILSSLPIFGNYVKTTFFWTLTPSLSYVGQGMIMGTRTGVSTLIGAIIGWGILGPIAHSAGWTITSNTPGASKSSSLIGVKGWVLWISLFIMLAESLVSLSVLVIRMVLIKFGVIKNYNGKFSDAQCVDPAPVSQRVPNLWWIAGTVASGILCVVIVSPLFGLEIYETVIAVVLSLLTSILAVRALGETDINPVSGIGKISQIIFAVVSPKNILANLVAGAIAEGGSQQAGDMMQDLKTGHLIKASPRVQFYGQLIGSFFSILFAVVAYELYSYAYTIPSKELSAPTATVWLNMAKLVNGGELAHNVLPFCIVLAGLVSLIPIAEAFKPNLEHYLPSGIALAIGFYQTPNYSLIRFVGTFVQWYWFRKDSKSFREYGIIVASGFVLGEGITSIITALMTIIGVPHL